MYQTETETETEVATATTTYTGRVKWFNSKAGYGFITVCDGEHAGKDIFVHYSAVSSTNPQYKYLVQGEYVEFMITKPENSDHEYHAVAVGGVKGGNLMCETRRESYAASNARKAATADTLPQTSTKPRNFAKRPTTDVKSNKHTTQNVNSEREVVRNKRSKKTDSNSTYQTRTVELQVPIVSAQTGEVVGYRMEKTTVFCPLVNNL